MKKIERKTRVRATVTTFIGETVCLNFFRRMRDIRSFVSHVQLLCFDDS